MTPVCLSPAATIALRDSHKSVKRVTSNQGIRATFVKESSPFVDR